MFHKALELKADKSELENVSMNKCNRAELKTLSESISKI